MDNLRKRIWDNMLVADLNERYYGRLSARFYSREIRLKCFAAVMSSGTVASWALWQSIDWLWKLASGLACICSLLAPILNYSKKLEIATRLKADWAEIRRRYDMLWVVVDDSSEDVLIKKLNAISEREQVVNELERHLPNEDRKLALLCENEVFKIRSKH